MQNVWELLKPKFNKLNALPPGQPTASNYWRADTSKHLINKGYCKLMHQQACMMQIPPYGLTRRRRPNSDCPPSLARSRRLATVHRCVHPGSKAPAVTPPSQSSPEWEKTCPDSSRTCMQNFTPLSFSAAEKSVTVQKTHSKLSIPHTTI